jgi:hypothetical protein
MKTTKNERKNEKTKKRKKQETNKQTRKEKIKENTDRLSSEPFFFSQPAGKLNPAHSRISSHSCKRRKNQVRLHSHRLKMAGKSSEITFSQVENGGKIK